MLKILDRYIIRKFLTTFFFMLGIIMLLAMVFDLSERLTEFINNQAPISAIIFDYYLNFIVSYGNMFSSMIIFVSVIWFTAKLAQDTEIIPMLNSGKPFHRFLRPYIISATILMLISLVLNHFILPNSNRVKLDFEAKYYRDAMSVEDYHAEYPGNKVVYFSSFYEEEGLANDFVLEQWDKNNRIVYFLKARTAYNKMGTDQWRLTDYFERYVGYPNDSVIEGKVKDTTFNFHIEEMAQRDNVAEAMSFSELKRFIQREKEKGSGKVPMYEIELYQRTSYPFATYVLTIIGVSVSSRKKRGGIGVSIALGLGIIFIYIFAMKVTTVAAINVGFPANIAVWVPNVLFGIVAYVLYRFAQK
ncbi:MAG: LptF/LptG family permease [Flavobacteriia bacterium]|jgi:lipopolysaccharide export system permease protein|nr:LptF/LptG family permease [Cryomorphaceae bacterium]